MKLWSAVVLLAGCASTPARPPVAVSSAPSPAPSGIVGHVTGSDGHPLTFAHVKLVNAVRKVEAETDAGPDGSFALPAPRGGDSVYALEASGAGHRPSTALIARRDEHVAVAMRLGTYRQASREAPQLLLFDRGKSEDATHVMTATGSGTFAVDIPLADGPYSYLLLAVAEGHSVNGTDSLAWEVDDEGNVRSRVTVTNGTLRVVFDPKKMPPPGQPPATTFADSGSVSARLADLYARIHVENEDFLDAMMHGLPGGVAELPAAHDKALHAVIDPQLGKEAGINWAAAAMASLAAFGERAPSDDDRVTVRRLLADVSPTDVLWDFFPGAIFRALEVGGHGSAYGEAFVRDHASSGTVGDLLVARIRASRDPVEARALVATLRTPRFAGTPAQEEQVDDLDPDRLLAPGKPFPAFAFTTLPESGAQPMKVTSESFAGKPYLVDIWATGCAPCAGAIAHLRDLRAKYGTRLGVLGISVDDRPTVIAFRKKQPMPWPTVMSTEEALKALTGIKSLGYPTLVLVDAKGVVVAVDQGPELDALLAKLLPQRSRAPRE